MNKKPFTSGDIAIMHITHRWATREGWATGGAAGPQELMIYEKIDLMGWPSHDDFKGHSERLRCGDIVLVLGYVGRPFTCTHRKEDSEYDVYEIFTKGRRLQVMRWNLELPEDYPDFLTGGEFV